ncbi:type VII secretion-associated serine protease mycosin [Actinoplanes subglobosus]|uniref:Type VII secretion-associated serine protease mycosin n=1 Tax=Actinoplanes subglobosus TaxID=1547892 RepID=A0ABV8INF2_9ACTN
MRLLPSIAVVAVAATTLVLPAAGPASAAAVCGPRITDQLVDQPWPLRRLRPDLVWPLTRGQGVLVAVIDSGVSVNHPALAGQVRPGQDMIKSGTNGWCDESGHGTIIAGIIAGKATPTSAFTGIAPGARILPIRVLRDQKRSYDPDDPHRIATAIRSAVDQGARVINLSVVTPDTPQLRSAVEFALASDVVLVAAAGNEGSTQLRDQPAYPAAYPGVLAVAGVDEAGAHVDTSTPGDYVDVAAPGKGIAGPAPNGGGYGEFAEGGTSFAAAYVSGLAALARSYRPREKASDVVLRIQRSAEHPAGGRDPLVGFGVINPYWAMTAIGGAGAEAGSGGEVTVPAPVADPLASTRVAAMWIAFAGVVIALLVVAGAAVVRRGRRRGWRPGRAADLPEVAATGRRPGFTPVFGRNMVVTAPSMQRPPVAVPGAGRGAAAPAVRGGQAPKVSMPTTKGPPRR